MIKAIVSDLSRVLLFPVDDTYTESLNKLNKQLHVQDSQYNFWQHFRLNDELLKWYRTTGLPCYIFTTEDIQGHPALSARLHGKFQEILSAKQLGITKKHPDSYKHIAEKIGYTPSEILFIDDTRANVEAAAAAGFEAVLYVSNEDSLGQLNSFLSQ